jgi:hypothetical protein
MRQVDIKGFDNYQVTDDGRVWSKKSQRYLTPTKSQDGYLRVKLCYGDGKYINAFVHRIVAKVFIPNPDNLPQINHKNEDKTLNSVENLEWCSSQYNNTYNNRHIKCASKVKESNTIRSGKPINQFTLDGEFVASYPSAWEASRQTGFTKQGIMIACHGGQMRKNKWVNTLQYKGYIWKYANN